MKFFAVICALACVAAAAVAVSDVELQFQSWMKEHQRTYAVGSDEYADRFAKFQASIVRVDARNNDPEETATFALGMFADMSPEEFAGYYLGSTGAKISHEEVGVWQPTAEVSSSSLPTSWDWRYNSSHPVVSPVKNQGQCGSCWAFSTTEVIESQWAMAGNDLLELAPQQIVDCDHTDDGCNGGDTTTAYAYVEKAGGMEPRKDYHYTAQNGQCKSNSADFVVSISGFQYAVKPGDEDGMQAAIKELGPLSICVDAAPWQDYNSGILKQCGQQVDHCVQIVGWSEQAGTPYWIVRNSWTNTWGINGYIWVERGHNLCAISSEVTYPTGLSSA